MALGADEPRLGAQAETDPGGARAHRLPRIEFWRRLGIDDTTPLELVRLLLEVNQLVNDKIERDLKLFDLGLTRFFALLAIMDAEEGMRLSDLGASILVHPTTVTVVVDHLVEDGLVRRERHATDRRARLAVLTPAGRALAQRVAQELVQANFGLPRLDHAKTTRLLELLAELRPAASAT